MALYYLYPTYRDYQLSKELSTLHGEDSANFVEKNYEKIKSARDGRIKLGLDLKGGMYVVLEVDVIKLLEDISKKKDDQLLQKILNDLRGLSDSTRGNVLDAFKAKLAENNLTLKNYYGELTDDESTIERKLNDAIDNAVDRAIGVIRNRVDRYGVAEPQIQKVGGNRIIVELPGVSNPQDVVKLLEGTALLTFHLLIEDQQEIRILKDIDKALAKSQDTSFFASNLQQTTDTTLKDKTTKTDTSKIVSKDKKDSKEKTKKDTSKISKTTKKDTNLANKTDTSNLTDTTTAQDTTQGPTPFTSLFDPELSYRYGGLVASETNIKKIEAILKKDKIKDVIPNGVIFAWSYKEIPDKGEKYKIMYILKKEPELTGSVITDARYTIDQQNNRPYVSMEMNSEGTADWARITGANINKRCAIVLDGVVYSAPVIKTKITGGNSMIEGMPSLEEAKLLAIVLQSGALPAPMRRIEERTIGPSLGEDSIRTGILSSIIALFMVALFMIVYYQFGGSVADLALLINVLFVMGIMAVFKATLTLPGIAGLILTLGMAVDTNVLIFERIREEMRTGKPLKTAIEIGYKKAFSAIIDSHLTSVITGIVLYIYGSGPIKGFAVTLLAGIGSNLFTAIVITHFIFDIMLEKGKKVSFG